MNPDNVRVSLLPMYRFNYPSLSASWGVYQLEYRDGQPFFKMGCDIAFANWKTMVEVLERALSEAYKGQDFIEANQGKIEIGEEQ